MTACRQPEHFLIFLKACLLIRTTTSSSPTPSTCAFALSARRTRRSRISPVAAQGGMAGLPRVQFWALCRTLRWMRTRTFWHRKLPENVCEVSTQKATSAPWSGPGSAVLRRIARNPIATATVGRRRQLDLLNPKELPLTLRETTTSSIPKPRSCAWSTTRMLTLRSRTFQFRLGRSRR